MVCPRPDRPSRQRHNNNGSDYLTNQTKLQRGYAWHPNYNDLGTLIESAERQD